MGKDKRKNILVANNIRSMVNVGSLFRIAESLDLELILQGYSPHPKIPNDTRLPYVIEKNINSISKTALHTINKVKWSYFNSAVQVLSYCRGTQVYCLEQGIEGAANIYSNEFAFKTPFSLVVGNEKTGVSQEFLSKCNQTLYIPMYGTQSSLNVAVSAAVALYELDRRRLCT